MKPAAKLPLLLGACVTVAIALAPVVLSRVGDQPSLVRETQAPVAPISVDEQLPSGAVSMVGIASVIDGDTLDLHGQRIRLWGIDAPESRAVCTAPSGQWRCGAYAASALDQAIAGRTVTCDPLDTDRYGRVLARCSVGGADINASLVSSGLAFAYRQYTLAYVPQEDAARAAGIGVWQDPNPLPPWTWRRENKKGAGSP